MAGDASRTLSGSIVTGGPTKQTFMSGIGALHHVGDSDADVDVKARRGSEQNQQLGNPSRHGDGLFNRDAVGGSVEDFTVFGSMPAG